MIKSLLDFWYNSISALLDKILFCLPLEEQQVGSHITAIDGVVFVEKSFYRARVILRHEHPFGFSRLETFPHLRSQRGAVLDSPVLEAEETIAGQVVRSDQVIKL